MKKLLLGIIIFCLPFLITFSVRASDTLVFDSTDHYLGACQLTDKSEWVLDKDINVSTFQVWYNWNQDEAELPVKVYKDGEPFAEFTATRSSCDTYQKQWCNADFKIDKLFVKGKYTTLIPNVRQCLKPGGTGAVRLYSPDNSAVATQIPVISTPISNIAATTYSNNDCSCNQTETIVIAIGISTFISVIVTLILKKK